MRPDLSVILPCYRAAPLARRSVDELHELFSDTPAPSFEIIVVDDGGGDFPSGLWDDPHEAVRLIRLPVNRGKGAAVAAGMAKARGRARIFTDVDLPYDPRLIPLAAEYLLNRHFHLVVGDRTLPGSVYHADIGWRRRAVSRLSSTFIGKLVTGGFFDTQCGFKGIRGDVADLVFPLLRLNRFAFDVELIYIALLHRLDIKRVPVRLRQNETSSVRVLEDSAQGFLDLFRIKYYQMRGYYQEPRIGRLLEEELREVRGAVSASGSDHRESSAPSVAMVGEG